MYVLFCHDCKAYYVGRNITYCPKVYPGLHGTTRFSMSNLTVEGEELEVYEMFKGEDNLPLSDMTAGELVRIIYLLNKAKEKRYI